MVLEIQKMIYDYKFVKLPKLGQFFRFLTSFLTLYLIVLEFVFTHTHVRVYIVINIYQTIEERSVMKRECTRKYYNIIFFSTTINLTERSKNFLNWHLKSYLTISIIIFSH